MIEVDHIGERQYFTRMMRYRRISVAVLLLAVGTWSWADLPEDGPASANPLTIPFLNTLSLPGGGLALENLYQMQPLGNIYGPHSIPAGHFYLSLLRQGPNPLDYTQPSILTTIKSPGHARLVMANQHLDQPGNVVAYKLTMKIGQDTYRPRASAWTSLGHDGQSPRYGYWYL